MISTFAFLIVFVLFDKRGFARWCDLTQRLYRNRPPRMDRFPGSLQAPDLVCSLVKLLQRFALVLLELVPKESLKSYS